MCTANSVTHEQCIRSRTEHQNRRVILFHRSCNSAIQMKRHLDDSIFSANYPHEFILAVQWLCPS